MTTIIDSAKIEIEGKKCYIVNEGPKCFAIMNSNNNSILVRFIANNDKISVLYSVSYEPGEPRAPEDGDDDCYKSYDIYSDVKFAPENIQQLFKKIEFLFNAF